jgi:hypothetical protein
MIFLTIGRTVGLLMPLLQNSHSNHHYKNIFLKKLSDTLDQVLVQGAFYNFAKKNINGNMMNTKESNWFHSSFNYQ